MRLIATAWRPHLVRRNGRLKVHLVLCSLLLSYGSIAHAAVSMKSLIAVGPPGGYTYAYAINNNGVVAGLHKAGYTNTPFLWTPSTGPYFLDIGYDGGAAGINDHLQVVGPAIYGYGTPAYYASPYIWDPIAGTTLFGFKPYSQSYNAAALNNDGDVVGGGPDGAFVWNQTTGTQFLDLGAVSNAQANDINDGGQIVGSYHRPEDGSHDYRAFLWDDDTVTELGTLGGSSAVAAAINERGDIVGASTNEDGVFNAFVWRNGIMTNLGTLAALGGTARGINDNGYVVGYSTVESGYPHAFVWGQDIGLVDLNDLLPEGSGWTLALAFEINNSNQLVGYGSGGGAFLMELDGLNSVPEPNSLVLVGLGLVGLGVVGRHKMAK